MTRISKICIAGAVALALSTSSAWAPVAPPWKAASRTNAQVTTPKVPQGISPGSPITRPPTVAVPR
jgi:hypothetical protein